MGHGWARGVHPDDLDRCLATYSSSFDTRRKFQMEYRLQRADGEYRWLLDNGTPLDRDGEFAGFIGSCIDITERKRAEEILKASEEKYRALVETTDTGYLIIDKEGKVIDANREYLRLTGHSELGEILGRSVIEWTAAHEKQRNAEALARCVKDGFIRDLVIDYVDGKQTRYSRRDQCEGHWERRVTAHHIALPRRQRPQAGRGGATTTPTGPGPEDGIHRSSGRRRGPRLQ